MSDLFWVLLTGQSPQFHAAADKIIKGDFAVVTVAHHDAIHGLRAQVVP